DGGESRLLVVAAENVGEAYLARGDLHGSTRDSGFAEIERAALPADPPAQHHEPGLDRPQLDIVDRLDDPAQPALALVDMRLRQHCHCRAPGGGHAVARFADALRVIGHRQFGASSNFVSEIEPANMTS